jgi:hypothetical protein
MRIIQCPKGDRIPEGFCRMTCLNYPGKVEIDRRSSPPKPKQGSTEKKHFQISFGELKGGP